MGKGRDVDGKGRIRMRIGRDCDWWKGWIRMGIGRNAVDGWGLDVVDGWGLKGMDSDGDWMSLEVDEVAGR